MSITHISVELREAVERRAGRACEYCRLSDETQMATFTCDHCVPESGGGLTLFDNLAWACPRCNAKKGSAMAAIDPETKESVPLFNPRQNAWSDNFKWADDGITLVALTATGRATIARLEMNQPKVLAVRALLKTFGMHPQATSRRETP